MATELSSTLTGKFHFGIERSRVAGMLRALANDIDQGIALPKKVDQTQRTVEDDYQATVYVIEVIRGEED